MIPFDWLDIVASSVANTLQTDIIATRLLLSVLLGYPISIAYSLLSGKWSVPQRQLFLLLCGVFLFSWNFGLDIIHMFIGIFVTMFVNYMCFRTKLSVIFAFVFNMAYLLSGSYIYNRGTYDINWTTPYCILCLRLIGLTWDLFDASKPESERSAYQKQSALQTFPGVLETLSFCFVPTAFISGPQFPMRHYQSFVDGSLRPTAILANRSFTQRFIFNVKVQRTVIRFTMGLLGILILSKMLTLYPAEYMLTEEFQQRWNVLSRFLYMVVFAQITLFRYVAIWLIGEGACVLLGLGCTGLVHFKYPEESDKKSRSPQSAGDVPEVRTKSALERRDSAVPWSDLAVKLDSYDPKKLDVREADHTACANISLGNLLLATNSDHLVAGFNINTNKWMLEYVYKRLRFLGNKQLSQLCTLTFLALWHGTYTGYFVNFALEFIIIAVERDFLLIVKRSKFGDFLYKTTPGFVLTSITGKLHVLFMLATPLTAFYLLQYHLWFPVLKSTYFIGFIYVLWPLLKPIVKRLFPRKVNGSQPNGGATSQSDVDKSKTQ
ncbi:Lysophospholipid acyltransferase 5 [Clonorchis sinensis]|uniref:Lysophospholipid acyltransferase 5 n=1 Tax=Clonorchis sinensis TaxID=79923 RepID=A0A8T1MK89_CLOSI|nr:Lysophospholipid acyltransferase 5 [Clonorchis sinensis]